MSDLPFPVVPRESVASHVSYAEAQRAVDFLSDQDFPVETVQIVGTDLRMVEQVYGRLDWGRAAVMGAGGGAWFGMLIGLLLGLFAGGGGLVPLLLWSLLVGAGFGVAFGVAAYAVTGGRRDFLSRSHIVPQAYHVLVETEHAERARQLLAAST